MQWLIVEINFRSTTHSDRCLRHWEGRKEMFYLTTHSTHFIYGYMASIIWLRTILIVKKETCCCHIGYSFRLTARVVLYAPSHRQDSTYHGLYYTSRGALAGTRNSSMGSPHEGSIRRPIAPWANALTTELHLAPRHWDTKYKINHVSLSLSPFHLSMMNSLYDERFVKLSIGTKRFVSAHTEKYM